MNNQIFEFYKVQLIELVEKFKQLKSDDQLIASAILKDTIEISNYNFNLNIYEGEDL